jgi:hypothetical protein
MKATALVKVPHKRPAIPTSSGARGALAAVAPSHSSGTDTHLSRVNTRVLLVRRLMTLARPIEYQFLSGVHSKPLDRTFLE